MGNTRTTGTHCPRKNGCSISVTRQWYLTFCCTDRFHPPPQGGWTCSPYRIGHHSRPSGWHNRQKLGEIL